MDKTFEQRMIETAEDAVIKALKDVVAPDYANRLKVPAERVQEIYAKLDWARISALVLAKAEDRVADTILNSMATEIATDVKQVLSNKELREDVRAYVRNGIRKIAEGVSE